MASQEIIQIPILPFNMVNAHLIKTDDGCILVDTGREGVLYLIQSGHRCMGKAISIEVMSTHRTQLSDLPNAPHLITLKAMPTEPVAGCLSTKILPQSSPNSHAIHSPQNHLIGRYRCIRKQLNLQIHKLPRHRQFVFNAKLNPGEAFIR